MYVQPYYFRFSPPATSWINKYIIKLPGRLRPIPLARSMDNQLAFMLGCYIRKFTSETSQVTLSLYMPLFFNWQIVFDTPTDSYIYTFLIYNFFPYFFKRFVRNNLQSLTNLLPKQAISCTVGVRSRPDADLFPQTHTVQILISHTKHFTHFIPTALINTEFISGLALN